MKKALVIGCGLTGAVIARKLAERNYNVTIWERRNHIGGNMYDFLDEYGIRLHKYGPHTFHTYKKELFDFICKYAEWEEYHLICGAEINGIITPSPFNFKTVDDFYPDKEADEIKSAFLKEFPGKETVTVVEALENRNKKIREYAQFLFDNDYSLYTAKQWGIAPEQIDSSVLKRVPLRLCYVQIISVHMCRCAAPATWMHRRRILPGPHILYLEMLPIYRLTYLTCCTQCNKFIFLISIPLKGLLLGFCLHPGQFRLQKTFRIRSADPEQLYQVPCQLSRVFSPYHPRLQQLR